MIQLSGNQKSSAFAMKRKNRRGQNGIAERPRIEVRRVVGGEHEAPARRHVARRRSPVPEDHLDERPAEPRRRRGRASSAGWRGHAAQYRARRPSSTGANVSRRWARASSSSSPPRRRERSRATSAAATRSSRASATSATSRIARRTSPRRERKRFGALGVDVEDDFEPYYVVDPDKKKVITELKKSLADADELLLATDEDREGEAIAWHLVAGAEAEGARPAHGVPRDHEGRDRPRARARRARSTSGSSTRRRRGASSTGSTATRCRRCSGRRSCRGSRPVACSRSRRGSSSTASGSACASSWRPTGTSSAPSSPARSRHASSRVDGKRVAQGRDFGEDGVRGVGGRSCSTRTSARALADGLDGRPFTVETVDEKPYTRRPAAPFRTSTLQQEASRKLRFSSQTTMRVAQRLYENGYITYMRTDSVDAVRHGAERRAGACGAGVRRRDRSRRAAPLRARGRERAGGARGDPAGRRRLPDARRARAASSRATSSRSTT